MPFSKCRDVLEKGSTILDGREGFVSRLRFRAHLMMCRDCRTYYRQFAEVVRCARAAGPEDHPEDLGQVAKYVLERLREEGRDR